MDTYTEIGRTTIAEQNTSEIITSVCEMGYTKTEITSGLFDLDAENIEITLDSLMSAAYRAKERMDLQLFSAIPFFREPSYPERLSEALDEIKAEYKYKIQRMQRCCLTCEEKPANVLLLPCCHLTSCVVCINNLRRCPSRKCNRIIRGTKEIFFS